MHIARLLKNELDIGGSLNKATVSNSRSDFSLILSLLSQNILDMAQFEINDNVDLRKQFELPVASPNQIHLAESDEFNEHSETFHEQDIIEFRLRETLKPEPLVFSGTESIAMLSALDNCDIHTVNRHKQLKQDRSGIAKIAFIDQLEQQRTMSKLIGSA